MNTRNLIIVIVIFIITGCQSMGDISQIATSIGVSTGVISSSQGDAIQKGAAVIQKSGDKIMKTFEEITPEQEYYIGRTVGAQIVSKYMVLNKERTTTYINSLGQMIAQASDRPETYGGYHFLILDSDEINAFAAPGGFIFISRGMLRCCKYEDAAAAVIAHEIAHIQYKHGLQAIEKSRVTDALTTLAIEGVKTFAGGELAKLTEVFEGSIADITNTLIQNGYSREFEREADLMAVTILKRAGYNPGALIDMLELMQQKLKPDGVDFARTHPSPGDRISNVKTIAGSTADNQKSGNRYLRFKAALGEI